ncbi:MAG: DUF456 domain-containing protein [Candidatus Marinimicrobia bacterium]|nr:DUF456 domain-containing protein [Candidatus Neomarinimicrobiota bacterium]
MEILTLLLIITITAISAVTIWLNLPGSFLMLIFIFIWAWIGDFALISVTEILIVLGIMLFLEIFEFTLSGLGAKYGGAEKRSAMMAIFGGLLGTILLGSLFFIVGALLGLFLGSYFGAYWSERQLGKNKQAARRAAVGALLGNLAAKIIKSSMTIIIGVWMIREVV